MIIKFNINRELKEEFLNTKPSATATAESFVLRSADEFEEMFGKSVYNMAYSELKEMISMQYKNSSLKAIGKNISILKKYVDFCIDKKMVAHGENRLASFTHDEIKKLAHRQALLNKYITKEQLRKYQNIMYNEQDKLFLELPFIGVRGRTKKGATYEEIINLTIEDVDEENKIIRLVQNDGTNRYMEVETSTIELIKEVYNQEYYVENNGEVTDNPKISVPRKIIINPVEKYVFRVPGKKKYQKFTQNLLNSRIRRIQIWTDNFYLTLTSLYTSGMLDLAMNIYKEKGEITAKDFRDICIKFKYGMDKSENYWYNLKNIFEQYNDLMENN